METTNKAIRIERLKQVRKQAKFIAEERRNVYENCKTKLKFKLENDLLKENMKLTYNRRNIISEQYNSALHETGKSHFSAHLSSDELVQNIKKTEEVNLVNEIKSHKRGSFALNVLMANKNSNSVDRKKIRKVLASKKESGAVNREDARSFAEYMHAKSHNLKAKYPDISQFRTFSQDKADHYSTVISERGPSVVNAKIIKHGLKIDQDKSTIHNSYTKELTSAARKIYKTVLHQLKSNSVAKKRAKVARQTAIIKKLTKTFEDDLALLHNLDRNGNRATRIKNIDSITKNNQELALSHKFEEIFLKSKGYNIQHDFSYESNENFKDDEYNDDEYNYDDQDFDHPISTDSYQDNDDSFIENNTKLFEVNHFTDMISSLQNQNEDIQNNDLNKSNDHIIETFSTSSGSTSVAYHDRFGVVPFSSRSTDSEHESDDEISSNPDETSNYCQNSIETKFSASSIEYFKENVRSSPHNYDLYTFNESLTASDEHGILEIKKTGKKLFEMKLEESQDNFLDINTSIRMPPENYKKYSTESNGYKFEFLSDPSSSVSYSGFITKSNDSRSEFLSDPSSSANYSEFFTKSNDSKSEFLSDPSSSAEIEESFDAKLIGLKIIHGVKKS